MWEFFRTIHAPYNLDHMTFIHMFTHALLISWPENAIKSHLINST